MKTTEMTYSDKYNFYFNTTTGLVVCATFYKGKLFKGTAKCGPEDVFDLETGKKLAYLRCRQKVLKNKLKRADDAYVQAVLAKVKAEDKYEKALEFASDVDLQYTQSITELNRFECELGMRDDPMFTAH